MAVDEKKQLELRRQFDPSKPAFKEYDDELIRLVRSSIMPREATNADTYFLLELSSRYGLDPFAREIWAAKMKGKTGEAGGVSILVGRDGLLTIAERHPQYRGFRNHPVYANDEFMYSADAREMTDGTFSHVTHSFDVTSPDRGALLGSWAEVYREGRPPTFFWAPLEDYLPRSEKKLEYSPWATQKSVMICKCSLATALRLAFRISGLYIEEEMTQALIGPETQEYVASEWPEDEELAAYLKLLFDVAEEAKPGSWLPGKVTATLEACEGLEEYEALAVQLEDVIRSAGGTVPDRPLPEAEIVFEQQPVAEGEPEPEAEDAEFEVDVPPLSPEEQAEADRIPFGDE